LHVVTYSPQNVQKGPSKESVTTKHNVKPGLVLSRPSLLSLLLCCLRYETGGTHQKSRHPPVLF